MPEEIFIWVTTKHEGRWVRSEIGTGFLTREVAALHCGLDATAWLEAGAWCAEALGRDSAQVPRRAAVRSRAIAPASAVPETRRGTGVIDRAEALRRAMLAHIDDGAPHEAHPSLWAPFVVVGAGR